MKIRNQKTESCPHHMLSYKAKRSAPAPTSDLRL